MKRSKSFKVNLLIGPEFESELKRLLLNAKLDKVKFDCKCQKVDDVGPIVRLWWSLVDDRMEKSKN